jgi:hypothetical protein
MPQVLTLTRWRAALIQPARHTLGARWRSTLEALEAARDEYRALHAGAAADVRALRKAAQRIHDLEQLRLVLARELQPSGSVVAGAGFSNIRSRRALRRLPKW